MPDKNTSSRADRSFTSRLKLAQLVLIEALDRHRSVLRAAHAVNMTQPAASKLLLQLEAALGAQLFERHPRGIEPTEAGAMLTRHARAALAELRQAQEELMALRSGLRGHVSLGTEATSATTLIPRAVATLAQSHPLVSVSIELAFSERLVRLVLMGELDMAVARVRDPRDRAALHCDVLPPARHIIAARTGHPLMQRRGLGWADLIGQTWIVPPEGNVMRSCLVSMLQDQGLPFPSQVVETAALPIIVSLLESTDMVAPLPESAVQPSRRLGLVDALPIEFSSGLGPAAVITARSARHSPSARHMLAILRETALMNSKP
ncbi:MAG: LysR family transcriptional regulator [Acetobacteraceae bacterium]|nr:LysR family transcriptional regulator [Acetobacteraceae bacterium]